MKKTQFVLSPMLPAMVLSVGVCLAGRPMFAQTQTMLAQPTFAQMFVETASDSSRDPATQQPMQTGDQNDDRSVDRSNDQNAASVKTFSGKIVKSGTRLVLSDAGNKTTYQLDDQQKAHDFLNKSVKVIGTLDASTGTIRVTAIELV
jgi:hypothetical protein